MIRAATSAADLSYGVRRARIGAVIAKGSRILAVAANTSQNDPKNLSAERLSRHAEWSALRMCGDTARGATLYVVRLMADGTLGMSLPCWHCEAAIDIAGIRKVVFSNWSGQIVESRTI